MNLGSRASATGRKKCEFMTLSKLEENPHRRLTYESFWILMGRCVALVVGGGPATEETTSNRNGSR